MHNNNPFNERADLVFKNIPHYPTFITLIELQKITSLNRRSVVSAIETGTFLYPALASQVLKCRSVEVYTRTD